MMVIPRSGQAQGPAPAAVAGSVRIDLAAGGIAADICFRNPPARDGVSFILQEAFELSGVWRTDQEEVEIVSAEPLPAGGGVHYTLGHGSHTDGSAPGDGDLCVGYAGTFPTFDVARGGFREDDRSELIAFNGRSLRARGISRWYPAITYPELGVIAEATAFDLEVECAECTWIHVNGGSPAPGPIARFHSSEPRELLLLAGDFPVQEIDGVHFLGEVVAADTARMFLGTLKEIQDFYADLLGIPFGPQPDILRITPLRVERRGQLWGFFSDPGLALIGMSIGEFVRILNGPERPARRSVFGFLTHELAHRYFGWRVGMTSPFREMYGEPFASYLELKAVRHFQGDGAYRQAVRGMREGVIGADGFVSLSAAGPEEFAVSRYRYGYAPLLLLALENEIGEAAMIEILRTLLLAPDEERAAADYPFLRDAALKAGAAAESVEFWETECVSVPVPQNSCLRRVGL
jgi:hypothetical protein